MPLHSSPPEDDAAASEDPDSPADEEAHAAGTPSDEEAHAVGTPSDDPAGQSPHAARRAVALRVLRLGGLGGLVGGVALSVGFRSALMGEIGTTVPIIGLLMAVLMVVAALIGRDPYWLSGMRRPFLLTSLPAVRGLLAAGACVWTWWKVWRESTVSIGPLLGFAVCMVGAGLSCSADFVLRSDEARTDSECYPRRRRLGSWARGLAEGFGGARRIGAVIGCVAVLTAAGGVPLALVEPVTQVVAQAPDPLPSMPALVGDDVAWEQEWTDPLDVVAGAAGPIVLTPQGVTAIDPADGSTLWVYEHDGASYVDLTSHGGFLVPSPDRRYIGLRIGVYGLEETGVGLTIILDALSGEVTAQRASRVDDGLQLTDSTALDGTIAFWLDGGSVRWSLDDGARASADGEPAVDAYSGPAGHSSFLLSDGLGVIDGDPWGAYMAAVVIPETDPTAETTVPAMLLDPQTRRPVVVDGWSVAFTDGVPAPRPLGADGLQTGAWQVQAIDLDAVAGGEAPAPVDLGQGVAVAVSSSPSGSLAVLSGQDVPEAMSESIGDGVYEVGAVFEPATGAVLPGDDAPGLAAATLAVTATAEKADVLFSVTVAPPGGSAVSIPFEGDSPLAPAELYHDERARPVTVRLGYTTLFAMSAPGVTVVGVRVAPREDGYSHVYRIYGLTTQGAQ